MNIFDGILRLIGLRPIVRPGSMEARVVAADKPAQQQPTHKPMQLAPSIMWQTAKLDPAWQSTLDWYLSQIQKNTGRYKLVAERTGVPWQVIAALHGMEAGFSMSKHLHNGDPLTARTVQVPRGRPITGSPPFSWVESAVDALLYDDLDDVDWEDLHNALDAIERYNGTGYRKRGINTPYLWSGTQHYRAGKFVRDGVFDASAVSKQLGVVPILKALGWHA